MTLNPKQAKKPFENVFMSATYSRHFQRRGTQNCHIFRRAFSGRIILKHIGNEKRLVGGLLTKYMTLSPKQAKKPFENVFMSTTYSRIFFREGAPKIAIFLSVLFQAELF